MILPLVFLSLDGSLTRLLVSSLLLSLAERQKHIFSLGQQARYQDNLKGGKTSQGGVNYTADVAGIKVKYWT